MMDNGGADNGGAGNNGADNDGANDTQAGSNITAGADPATAVCYNSTLLATTNCSNACLATMAEFEFEGQMHEIIMQECDLGGSCPSNDYCCSTVATDEAGEETRVKMLCRPEATENAQASHFTDACNSPCSMMDNGGADNGGADNDGAGNDGAGNDGANDAQAGSDITDGADPSTKLSISVLAMVAAMLLAVSQ